MAHLMKTMLALAALVAVGSAGRCYTCSYYAGSTASAGCNDDFTATSSDRNCGSSVDKCIKIKATDPNGNDFIQRGCAPGNQCSEGSYSAGGYNGNIYCCTGDNCNGSTAVKGTMAFTIGCIVAAFVMTK